MIPILLALIFADVPPVNFEPQDIPSIRANRTNDVTGIISTNFRVEHVDFDDEPDLLFANKVLFYRDGKYLETPFSNLPFANWSADLDYQDGKVYLRSVAGLHVYVLRESGWTLIAEYMHDWPDSTTLAMKDSSETYREGGPPRLGRFMLPGTKSAPPTLLVPYFDGIHMYAASSASISETNLLPVFPDPSYGDVRALGSRATAEELTSRRWRFNVLAERDQVLTWIARTPWSGRVRYYAERTEMDWKDGAPILGKSSSFLLPEMPSHLSPCDLNNDDLIDVAGSRVMEQDSKLPSVPIHVTEVSLDEGETFQQFRVRGWQPNASLCDVNNDGLHDVITESSGLLSSGPRETINRWLTLRHVEHTVSVHLQTPEKEFASEPDFSTTFIIKLPSPPARNEEFFHRYRWGELVSLLGDYNGDGYNDLVAQIRPDRLAVFLGSPEGILNRRAKLLAVPKMSRFAPFDINADGRDDLIVQPIDQNETGEASPTRVFISTEPTP